MIDTVADACPTTVINKPRQKRLNTELAGVLLTQGLDYEEIAKRIGSVSGNSVRVALARKGITMRNARGPAPTPERIASVTMQVVSDADSILRERLNKGLGDATEALLSKRPSYRNLASKGQGHAATLKQLAETWRTLNGNPDSITFSFGASRLSDARETPQPAVECEPIESTCVQANSALTTSGTPPVQAPDNV